MTDQQKQSFMEIIRSCEDAILATNRPDGYPDSRTVINIFNREISGLDLYLFSSTKWNTPEQIRKDQRACLYYFNPATRMSLRLFGDAEIIDDMHQKQEKWLDGIRKFGVSGYDDPTYVLMRFAPKTFKYYVGPKKYEGEI